MNQVIGHRTKKRAARVPDRGAGPELAIDRKMAIRARMAAAIANSRLKNSCSSLRSLMRVSSVLGVLMIVS